jgi:N6-adenosine-specific RNA methylase IME4
MALADLRALELPAGERCVLCLWSVISLQPQAFALLADWGFRYESQIVWDKGTIGPGVYVRNQHELLLIAFKGASQPPDPLERPPSVIRAKRGRHSEKPAIFAEWLERMYPSLSKLELFARGKPRPGWSAWGNEVVA